MKFAGLISIVLLMFAALATPSRGAMDTPSELLGYLGGANDNPHNLSKYATHGKIQADDDGSIEATRICIYCHTPHGATAQSTLWNRLPSVNMGNFPLYDQSGIVIGDPAISGTSKYKLDGDQGAGDEYPNGSTKLCLSCHDGATAVGLLSVGPAITMNYDTLADWSAAAPPGEASTLLDPGNFNKTHPVSFVYTSAVRDYINGPGGKTGYSLPTDPDVRLDGQNRMQCTTCHDPHRHTRTGGYSLPFWANKDLGVDSGAGGNNDYDRTCTQCHGATPGTAIH